MQNPFLLPKISRLRITEEATGFEALLGYLYLKENWKRMLDLVKIGLGTDLEKEEA